MTPRRARPVPRLALLAADLLLIVITGSARCWRLGCAGRRVGFALRAALAARSSCSAFGLPPRRARWRGGAPVLAAAAAADPRPVPRRRGTHQRRRRQLLRLRPLALAKDARPRLHQRVRPLRPPRRAATSRCPRGPACAARSSRSGPRLVWLPVLRGWARRSARAGVGLGPRRRPVRATARTTQRGGPGQPAATASRRCC